MEPYEMLAELIEMDDAGEIYNDDCEHREPAMTPLWDPEDETGCFICFIRNMSNSSYENQRTFEEETTQAQRDAIAMLWDRYA